MNNIRISIENNEQYSRDHNEIIRDEYECCNDECCPNCNGTGTYIHETMPNEIHLSSERMALVLSLLALDVSEYVGSYDSRLIMSRINSITPERIFAGIQNFNVELDHMQWYTGRLYAMCVEAERREENIIWS